MVFLGADWMILSRRASGIECFGSKFSGTWTVMNPDGVSDSDSDEEGWSAVMIRFKNVRGEIKALNVCVITFTWSLVHISYIAT